MTDDKLEELREVIEGRRRFMRRRFMRRAAARKPNMPVEDALERVLALRDQPRVPVGPSHMDDWIAGWRGAMEALDAALRGEEGK